nr:MarR family transcriptional regulator [Paracoccus sp. NBH48]
MGSRWGINRTVGQVYALLFLADEPLCADDIVAALGFSRSNVSMALKELQSWNLVRLRHQQDDRREILHHARRPVGDRAHADQRTAQARDRPHADQAARTVDGRTRPG